jgi:stearoyl-CoA desaturase (delta-9 desaturase)
VRAKFNIALFWGAHPAFLWFASYETQWVALGLVWSWLVLVVGLQIGAHRYFTHSSFMANKFQAGLMNCMAMLGGMGTPQDWMIAHTAHHRFADTDSDPTNWRVIGLWRNYSSLWQLHVLVTPEAKRLAVRSLRSPFAKLLYDNYVKLLTVWGLVLFMLNTQAFAWLFLLPILTGHWAMNLLNHIGHRGGDHERATSTSRFFNAITPGDGYHDFHHQNPRAHRFGRYDMVAWIIDKFLSSRAKNTRPTHS